MFNVWIFKKDKFHHNWIFKIKPCNRKNSQNSAAYLEARGTKSEQVKVSETLLVEHEVA